MSSHAWFILAALGLAIGFAALWVVAKRACDRIINQLFFEADEHSFSWLDRNG